MRDYAREAVAFLSGRAQADLDTNRILQLAIVHLLNIISEAASRVTPISSAPPPATRRETSSSNAFIWPPRVDDGTISAASHQKPRSPGFRLTVFCVHRCCLSAVARG